jgi:hypothetical protein
VAMRRVMTALVLAGAIALVVPCNSFAQRGGGGHGGGFSGGGHAAGFSGGHVGGFSGGHGFGGGFSAPSSGFGSAGLRAGGLPARSFPAPRMNFMPRPATPGPTRFAPTARPYGGFNGTRSPFGQLSIPAVRRAPYPGAANRGSTNQPYRSGNNQWHGGDKDGHNHNRSSYYKSTTTYSWPYAWPYYASSYWPWWPYFGDWDSTDNYASDSTNAPAQQQDQYSAPEQEQQDPGRPAYESRAYQSASAASAMPEPAVTIIYKDGHSQEINNYALTRTTLLMLDNASAGVTPQVPLDQINLSATEQANRAQGVNFSVPVQN